VGGLQSPNLADYGAKSSKVSGCSLKYSRFRETATGDWVRSTLRGGASIKAKRSYRLYTSPTRERLQCIVALDCRLSFYASGLEIKYVHSGNLCTGPFASCLCVDSAPSGPERQCLFLCFVSRPPIALSVGIYRTGLRVSVTCKTCGASIPRESRVCLSCQSDAGFPNVRRAEKPDEVAALSERIREIDVSANARNALDVLNEFTDAVGRSNAVMNRRLDDLHTWTMSGSQFFASFHSQIRDGAIAARENGWDEQRTSFENSVNPIYFAKLQVAALCLDDSGMSYYGEYCVRLREKLIANRASVFEENPIIFCRRHAVYSGATPPVGFRATWPDRSRLARAKLGQKVLSTTVAAEFPAILMSADRDSENCDFIEVHIYEKVGRDAMEAVTGPIPKDGDDRLLWKLIRRKLESLGVNVQEQ
jgi:hypothetical protein